MCSIQTWDFDCPQFVDFQAGLETSTTDIWLEDEKSHQKAITTLRQPFKSRMATPKINLQLSPYVKMSQKRVKTDDEKLASISQLPRRYSKSDTCLNRLVETWMTPKVKHPNRVQKANRKRSLSENNIKKKVYPVTPMCLKRTIKKTKGKTTEEIEMDKITELQNKLKQQLRLNEVNLKRIKNNKVPYPAQKVLKQKTKAKTAVAVKDDNLHLQPNRLNNRKTTHCVNFEKTKNPEKSKFGALRVQSKKLQSVVDSVFKNSEASSNVLRDVNGNNNKQQKKFKDHCGIKFFPHQKNTMPHPFSFDTSSVSSLSSSFCFKDIRADSFALKTPDLNVEKENIFRSLHRKQRK